MRNLIFIFCIISLISCSPDRFMLNLNYTNAIYGKILSNIDDFEQINDNSFILTNGVVSTKVLLSTQNSISFNYSLLNGDKVRFVIRTVAKEYNSTNGLIFELSGDGTNVFENDKLIFETKNITAIAKKRRYINIQCYGDLTIFTQDCEEIKIKSKLYATEYLIVDALNINEIEISGMEFERIFDNYSIKSEDF